MDKEEKISSDWLVSVEGHEYRVKAETRDKAIREAVKQHVAVINSHYSLSVLAIMARTRKLEWKGGL